MSIIEDSFPVLWPGKLGERIRVYSDSLLQNLSQSISNINCETQDKELPGCRDDSLAVVLKFTAIAAIMVAGACGVGIPLVGKKCRFLQTDSNLFVIIKSFAGGVILATGFVHMLPDATSSLTDPCLPKFWSSFPFAGFIAMMATLATLLVDFVGTQYYEKKQVEQNQIVQADSLDTESEPAINAPAETMGCNGKVFGEEEGGAMHIVGMHAHAAHHRHSHPQEEGACQGLLWEDLHDHSPAHEIGTKDEESGARHVVVSQVLELGIVSHSVIIGLSLGVSNSPCTIRPLIGALSFHQFFEGFALGGCISQAKLRTLHSTIMAFFFAVTTPLGIGVGMSISSIYNANSPRALIVEGVFDSISAGILVYMALVDLIAADFLSKRMSCNLRLQMGSYFSLFLGAVLMSLLAVWA